MSELLPAQIVVADDVCRFALYVWRYLSRSIGFGTSDFPNDPGDDHAFPKRGELHCLATAAKDADVWWLNVNKDWNRDLESLFQRIGTGGRRLFVVDVRGPYGFDSSAKKLVQTLAGHGVVLSEDENKSEVLLVSSYTVAPQTVELEDRSEPLHLGVRPKSPETLEWISRRIRSCAPKHSRRSAKFSQVLVTGAGFELHDKSLRCRRLGMSFTDDVLEKALNASLGEAIGSKGFLLPMKHAKNRSLQSAANKRDLDRYWNELLLLELARVAREEDHKKPRPTAGEVKLRASRHEYRLRETFRQQFVADDWGFLGQALNVLEMEESCQLVAWLTTNYTRFADRAIDLWSQHQEKEKEKPGPMWRIVSTGSEAERLLRELLHGSQRTGGCDDKCILFKLHGDLAHLLTMAIAGHDKDISSPLSLPISSLHSVYVAADLYLKQRLAGRRQKVLWHIVGHGLKDNLLVEVLANVCGEKPGRHWFVVVDPAKAPDGPKILTKRLSGAQVVHARLNADDYMARMLRNPPTSLSRLETWVRDLGASES